MFLLLVFAVFSDYIDYVVIVYQKPAPKSSNWPRVGGVLANLDHIDHIYIYTGYHERCPKGLDRMAFAVLLFLSDSFLLSWECHLHPKSLR